MQEEKRRFIKLKLSICNTRLKVERRGDGNPHVSPDRSLFNVRWGVTCPADN